MTREKRKHQRFPVGISFDIHAKGQGVQKRTGTITDLSLTGMTFNTDAELEAGQSLYLRLNLPLEIRGEVRSITEPAAGGVRRYGIQFHHIGSFGPAERRPENFIAARFQK
ncbi:MAG: PilZ domain-containing protein [Elusimicrobia bacterium]|nr:PilZ domain-containing protein [Elusimicrobiota bacterium]